MSLNNTGIIKGFDNMNLVCPTKDTLVVDEVLYDWIAVVVNNDENKEPTLSTVTIIIAINVMILIFLSLSSSKGRIKTKKASIMYGCLIKLINRIETRNIAKFFLFTSPKYILIKYVTMINTNVKINAS